MKTYLIDGIELDHCFDDDLLRLQPSPYCNRSPIIYNPSKPEIFFTDGKIKSIAVNRFSNRYVLFVENHSCIRLEPAEARFGFKETSMNAQEFKQFRKIIIEELDDESKEEVLKIIEQAASQFLDKI